MPHRVKRTRLALGTLLLGAALLAPAPGLRSVHANAGCGIDPNGTTARRLP
jgi:hypothetical protein